MDKKILLIDNQPDLPTELAYILFDAGYHVLNIADHEESFEIIENQKPDLIIFNNYSENHDIDIFQRFKSATEENILIMFIPDQVFPTEKLTISGTDGYILKNATNLELLEKIEKLFN
jgi:DNA-binding response OmpR family regulator